MSADRAVVALLALALAASVVAGCSSGDGDADLASEPVEPVEGEAREGADHTGEADEAPSVELGAVSEEDLFAGCLAELDPEEGGAGDGGDGGQSSSDQAPGLGEVVVLADSEGFRYCVGPALLVEVESAAVGSIPGAGPTVDPVFTDVGIEVFNTLAAECFVTNQSVCPTGQVAVVSAGVVISAPTINAAAFARDQIVISGTFTDAEAAALATALSDSGRVEMRAVLLALGPDLDG